MDSQWNLTILKWAVLWVVVVGGGGGSDSSNNTQTYCESLHQYLCTHMCAVTVWAVSHDVWMCGYRNDFRYIEYTVCADRLHGLSAAWQKACYAWEYNTHIDEIAYTFIC